MSQSSNYALRLQKWIKLEGMKLAKEQGTTLNQLINVALAEKIAALKTVDYLRKRGERGDPVKALEILRRAGSDEKPREGDEP